jgi:TetR/AcrR family transcriptional repressor of nem operon
MTRVIYKYDEGNTIRYASDHKQRTHERILAAASRLFRERGILGAGVDGVMRQAGLTAGGFYAHFRSKDDLLVQSLRRMLEQQRERLLAGLDGRIGVDWLRELVRRYLSRSHRDDVADGDALPALISELSRAPDEAKETFETHFLQLVRAFERKTPPGPGLDPTDRALATIALAVGGLTFARAVKSRALSDRILTACRRLAVPELADQRKEQR